MTPNVTAIAAAAPTRAVAAIPRQGLKSRSSFIITAPYLSRLASRVESWLSSSFGSLSPNFA